MSPFFEKYFSFQGRLRRSQYWLWHLAQVVMFIAGVLALYGLDYLAGDNIVVSIILGIIGLALYIGFVWAALSVSVRRCHDRDKSGWFILVGLIPLVNFWVLIELGFLDGTQGPNQYGPSPKGIGGTQVANVFS